MNTTTFDASAQRDGIEFSSRDEIPPLCGAKEFRGSAPLFCSCGQALLPTGGRPRVTCSSACRRRRDGLLKKWHRRREWLAAWRAATGNPLYSRARIRREIHDLRAELSTLRAALLGPPDVGSSR